MTLLLENGAPLSTAAAGSGETALMVAAEGKSGDEKALEILLKWVKKDKDKEAVLEARDSECGRTALLWATEAGRDKAVTMLLEAGADINATCEIEGWFN